MRYKLYIVLLACIVLQSNSKAQFTKMFDLDNIETGSLPYYIALCSDGTWLYGTASNGGVDGRGTIYKIKPDGTDFTKIFDFDVVPSGQVPESGLIIVGEYLYGNTTSGGEFGFGTIYKIKTDGTGFIKLHDFTGDEGGRQPHGNYYFDGTYLFGITTLAGLYGGGTLYKIKPDGTDFTIIFHFEIIPTGNSPYGAVISDGTYLYGMTAGGGILNQGVVYKIKPDGTEYTNLIEFIDDPNGSEGYGSVVFDGTFLYGMTNGGGVDNRGTIFKVKTDGSEYQKLLDFDDVNGAQPLGSLILVGTTLYGMAEFGGDVYAGTIFQLQTDGSDFTVIHEFDGYDNGALPFGTLLYENGALFGVTHAGGLFAHGVIFRYGEIVSSITETNTTILNVHPNPNSRTFYIDLTEKQFTEVSKLEMFNLMGERILETVISSRHEQVDIGKVSSGMYIIRVSMGSTIYSEQIIIN